MFEITLEREDDHFEVEDMVRNSFWNIYRPGAYEHLIVHNLRDDESFISNLAYVIKNDDIIVGHINYSKGKIDHGNEIEEGIILGPVSIDRDYQNRGLGTWLIEHTLCLAKKEGIPFVFVVGDESYYSRFGFRPASEYGLYLEGTDVNEENPFFMIKIFNKSEIRAGTFKIPDVFDVDESEVDEFDKRFEHKEKLILKGQLGV